MANESKSPFGQRKTNWLRSRIGGRGGIDTVWTNNSKEEIELFGEGGEFDPAGFESENAFRKALRLHNNNFSNKDRRYIPYKEATKIWEDNAPEKENEPPTSEPVPSNMTLQEARDMFYNKEDYSDKGYFQDVDVPTDERREEYKKAIESGYLADLRKAVEAEYGEDIGYGHGYTVDDDIASNMARNAMIDPETKKILPMSSASGGWSGHQDSSRGDGNAMKMKKQRGYKMPGYGKRQ